MGFTSVFFAAGMRCNKQSERALHDSSIGYCLVPSVSNCITDIICSPRAPQRLVLISGCVTQIHPNTRQVGHLAPQHGRLMLRAQAHVGQRAAMQASPPCRW